MSQNGDNPKPTGRAKVKRGAHGHVASGGAQLRGRPTSGRITRLVRGLGHGFIRAADNRQVYFHRSEVPEDTFNDLAIDDPVTFDLLEDAVTGPRATRVRKTQPR